jgi:hypothetical protein
MSVCSVFIDWAVRKSNVAVIVFNGEERQIVFKELEKLLNVLPKNVECRFYLETGASKSVFVWRLLSRGRVFFVAGKTVKDEREKGGKVKSDATDARIIRNLFSKCPTAFKESSAEEKSLFELRYILQKHKHITKSIARLKNQAFAYRREFGDSELYNKQISSLNKEKRLLFKEFKQKSKNLLKPVLDTLKIKGLGPITLGTILVCAPPLNFPSQSKYLRYFGYNACVRYKDPSKGHVKGNILIKRPALRSKVYEACECIIRNQDKKWYPFYLKLKADMRTRFPAAKKGVVHKKAMNRMGTFLLKEIYQTTHRLKTNEQQINPTTTKNKVV